MNCSAIPGGINPVEYSALVIVELFPIIKLLKKDEDAAEYQSLIRILETVRDQANKHDYSKASVVEMVKDRFLSNLSIVALKDIIKDSAFCQFPESLVMPMKFKGVSANPPQLRTDYGEEDYFSGGAEWASANRLERKKPHNNDAGFDSDTKKGRK